MMTSVLGNIFSYKLVVLTGISAVLSSCQPATLSLEKARQVTATFEGETFKRPPKTIRDITAILDQQDIEISPKTILLRRQSAFTPPKTGNNAERAMFHLRRSRARLDLGMIKKASNDARLAYQFYLKDPDSRLFDPSITFQMHRFAALAEMRDGFFNKYLDISKKAAEAPKATWSPHREVMNAHIMLGDFEKAKKAKATSDSFAEYVLSRERAPASAKAFALLNLLRTEFSMLESQGRWKEAEPVRREAIQAADAVMKLSKKNGKATFFPPLRGRAVTLDKNNNRLIEKTELRGGPLLANFKSIDCDKSGALDGREIGGFFRKSACPKKEPADIYDLKSVSSNLAFIFRYQLGENLLRQGRPIEAEAIIRETLLSSLKLAGKNSVGTIFGLRYLSNAMSAQGRNEESLKLREANSKIMSHLGFPADSSLVGSNKFAMAKILSRLDKWEEASELFKKVSKELLDNRAIYLTLVSKNSDLPLTLLKTGDADSALEILEPLYKNDKIRLGVKHVVTATKGALIAATLLKQGEHKEALQLFQTSIPILLSKSRQSNDTESENLAKTRLNRILLESYLELLATIRGTELEKTANIDATAEAFRIADIARSGSVQGALAASGARASADNKELSDFIRKEQDARKQIGALFALQANILSSASDQQDPAALTQLRTRIDNLRTARATIAQEIEKRFPLYAELINPKPATVSKVQKSLKDDEALIATYVVEKKTYVWTVTKTGKSHLHVSPLGAKRVNAVVSELRKALDPQAASLGDIPSFNVNLSHRLFRALLQPGAKNWVKTKSLLIVPHGSIAQLPFGVLVTKKKALPANQPPLFSNYKEIPWLIKSHSITVLPSVTALASLRALPKPKEGRRPFVGFGDPYFSQKQAEAAAKPKVTKVATLATRGILKTRGIKIKLRNVPKTQDLDSAHLGLLPRLPDTFDEVKSIALATSADLTKDVFTGASANEDVVKKLDLSGYKVVTFATHGLIPGDLDGLNQPALALSTPKLGGFGGDGLLTMDEILSLKLDADWVVLSACNTASADGAGAEAFSGLGRAFFYAGTRAMLLSNWPVETTSAKKLTTDLFGRQAKDPKLTRSKALKEAMLGLINGDGFKDETTGKIIFSYAHPIFWAPFSLVGDGGV